MDYVGPDVELDEVKTAFRKERRTILYRWTRTLSPLLCSQYISEHQECDTEVKAGEKTRLDDEQAHSGARECMAGEKQSVADTSTIVPNKGAPSHVCGLSATEPDIHPQSLITFPEPATIAEEPHALQRRSVSHGHHPQSVVPTPELPSPSLHRGRSPTLFPPSRQRLAAMNRIFSHALAFLNSLVTPPSVSILLSFPIALIPSLKALFVTVPSVHMPSAPDGLPPLAFFFDTTAFIGAASVPLGLICLGSALARLNFPRDREGWRMLPVGAITGVAVGRMIIMPVLGVLLVQGLVNGGIIPKEDKVLQFVSMCGGHLSC